jgi:P4 family phage/plasmid primase-like protien
MMVYQEEDSLTDALAKRVLEQYRFASLIETEDLFCYDAKSGVYRPGGDVRVKQFVEAETKDCTNHLVSEVVGKVIRRSYVFAKDFDKDPALLNVSNGFVDVRTGEFYDRGLKAATVDGKLSRIQVPVTFDAEAGCPAIMRFLEEVLPEEDERLLLLEFVSTCLLRTTDFQKALMLIGEGNNGKSTFLRMLRTFLGRENVSDTAIHRIASNRFAAAEFEGKLANIYPDISSEEISETGILKSLIGGDPMTVERKGRDPFELEPFTKMVFSCNRLPQVPDDSDAWFRRWAIIYFRANFEGRERREILGELTTDAELSGFLNVLLKVLRELLARGQFAWTQSTQEMRKEWGERANTIVSFVATQLVRDAEAYEPKDAVYARYVSWCQEKRYSVKGKQRFYDSLQEVLPLRDDIIKPGGRTGKSVRVWRGLRFKVPQPGSTSSTGSTLLQPPTQSSTSREGVGETVEHVEPVERPEKPASAPVQVQPDVEVPTLENGPGAREPRPGGGESAQARNSAGDGAASGTGPPVERGRSDLLPVPPGTCPLCGKEPLSSSFRYYILRQDGPVKKKVQACEGCWRRENGKPPPDAARNNDGGGL